MMSPPKGTTKIPSSYIRESLLNDGTTKYHVRAYDAVERKAVAIGTYATMTEAERAFAAATEPGGRLARDDAMPGWGASPIAAAKEEPSVPAAPRAAIVAPAAPPERWIPAFAPAPAPVQVAPAKTEAPSASALAAAELAAPPAVAPLRFVMKPPPPVEQPPAAPAPTLKFVIKPPRSPPPEEDGEKKAAAATAAAAAEGETENAAAAADAKPDAAMDAARENPERYQGTATTNEWKRPPLSECSPEDFMLDFFRFHESRGDDWEIVWDILDNALRRSGRPHDTLGLYRHVCARGGFISRESAKARIKMPEVFGHLFNYWIGHTYTDIGNNLLNVYERYFLPYEVAHPEDTPEQTTPCVACARVVHAGGDAVPMYAQSTWIECDACGERRHECCASRDDHVRSAERDGGRATSYVCEKCAPDPGPGTSSTVGVELSIAGERVVVRAVESPGGGGGGGGGGDVAAAAKRKRDAADKAARAKMDEHFERYLAMQRRRGRAYDANHVRPVRAELPGLPISKKLDKGPGAGGGSGAGGGDAGGAAPGRLPGLGLLHHAQGVGGYSGVLSMLKPAQ